MRLIRRFGPIVTLAAIPGLLSAQNVISARAGLVHLADGRVLLDEKPIVHNVTRFSEVKDHSVLRTERGRVEILLTPGVFLRLGEDSRLVMLSGALTDVRVKLEAGSAVVEADELDKSASITVVVGESEARLDRTGLYRFDVYPDEARRLRVFTGQALVGRTRVGARKEVRLDGDLTVTKFDPEDTDPLDRWSRRRANYIAMASVSASRLAWEQDRQFTRSSWVWNPYYGMYAFLPFRGVCNSVYGYAFYSPRAVYALYNPPVRSQPSFDMPRPSFNSSYGYSTVGQTSAGTSGVMATSPSAPVSQGGEATVSRGGDTGGGGARR